MPGCLDLIVQWSGYGKLQSVFLATEEKISVQLQTVFLAFSLSYIFPWCLTTLITRFYTIFIDYFYLFIIVYTVCVISFYNVLYRF